MVKNFDIEVVGKIGSMALIRKSDNDIDYNIFSRLGAQLVPGIVWISSGATEIGRLDYLQRHGSLPQGGVEEIKSDFAALGQIILMENYRRFISQQYSMRQLLVEHTHFNDVRKRDHIKGFLIRAASQGAIPIINYNDPVSFDENRHLELDNYRKEGNRVVECIDNDETASEIACLVRAKHLIIMTSVDGIYEDPSDPKTLVKKVTGSDKDSLIAEVKRLQKSCKGASREGAGGAYAKLEYILPAALAGTQVTIGHARYKIDELISGLVPCTKVFIGSGE